MELHQAGSAERPAHVLIIKLEGEFDLSDGDRLRDAFFAFTQAACVVVDFHRVTYVDSSVLRCLFALRQKTLERGTALALVGVTGAVAHVFEICCFDRLFEIRETIGDVSGASAFDGAEIRTLTLVSRVAEV